MEVERTKILVRTESPAMAIRHVLEQERPELLTIGASRWLLIKRLLIGSVTDSSLRTALCDVLVIPHRLPARLDSGRKAPQGSSDQKSLLSYA